MRNSCYFTGRLVADPKLFEGNPNRVCFTISVLGDFKDKEGKVQSSFLDFIAWRDTADYIARHFHKGDMLRVDDCEAKVRNYEDSGGVKHRKVEFEVDGIYNIFGAGEID